MSPCPVHGCMSHCLLHVAVSLKHRTLWSYGRQSEASDFVVMLPSV